MIQQATGFDVQATWTGQLDVELRNGRNWSVGTIDIRLGLDTVSLWYHDRSLAVMDRDQFREWLFHPRGLIFEVDDVVWSVEAGVTCLTVGGTGQYTVTPESVRRLTVVV